MHPADYHILVRILMVYRNWLMATREPDWSDDPAHPAYYREMFRLFAQDLLSADNDSNEGA